MAQPAEALKFDPGTRDSDTRGLLDLRFRRLLGEAAWARLPPAVQARFSKRLDEGRPAIYCGRITCMRVSRAGRILARALRVIGAPLPLDCKVGDTSIVTVTEDARSHGQFWSRHYARRRGFPQIVQSSKRFCGPTGLEEAIGFGIVMALGARAENGALVFRSAGYAIATGSHRLPFPQFLSPGALTVTHREVDTETFLFSLHLEHPRFGLLMHQEGLYREAHA